MSTPHVVVLGGPNGAGKSTVAPRLLRDALGVKAFVNADEIARGLAGFAPETAAIQAGRIMLDGGAGRSTVVYDPGLWTTMQQQAATIRGRSSPEEHP